MLAAQLALGLFPPPRCGAAVTQGLIAPVSVTRPRAVLELFPPAFCELHKLLTGMLLGRRGDSCCLAQRGTASRALWEAPNPISSRFLGPVLFLQDCSEMSLFVCLCRNDICNCVSHSNRCVTADCLGRKKKFGIVGNSLKGK